jgi:hypothetical protein
MQPVWARDGLIEVTAAECAGGLAHTGEVTMVGEVHGGERAADLAAQHAFRQLESSDAHSAKLPWPINWQTRPSGAHHPVPSRTAVRATFPRADLVKDRPVSPARQLYRLNLIQKHPERRFHELRAETLLRIRVAGPSTQHDSVRRRGASASQTRWHARRPPIASRRELRRPRVRSDRTSTSRR